MSDPLPPPPSPFVSIASNATDFTLTICGQSFTTFDVGPNGEAPLILVSISFGYPDYSTVGRAMICYLYDVPLENPDDIGRDFEHMIVESDGCGDDSQCGPGSFTRTFGFPPTALSPNTVYYIYLISPKDICVNGVAETLYDGGSLYDSECTADAELTAQFKVLMVVQETEPS